jgi:hypothetical protein
VVPVLVSLVFVEASAPGEPLLVEPSGSEHPQAAAPATKPTHIQPAKTRTVPPLSFSTTWACQGLIDPQGCNPWDEFDGSYLFPTGTIGAHWKFTEAMIWSVPHQKG